MAGVLDKSQDTHTTSPDILVASGDRCAKLPVTETIA